MVNKPGTKAKPATRITSLLTRKLLLPLSGLMAGFYFGCPLLIPLALVLTLNFLLAPVVSKLQRFHLHRTPTTRSSAHWPATPRSERKKNRVILSGASAGSVVEKPAFALLPLRYSLICSKSLAPSQPLWASTG